MSRRAFVSSCKMDKGYKNKRRRRRQRWRSKSTNRKIATWLVTRWRVSCLSLYSTEEFALNLYLSHCLETHTAMLLNVPHSTVHVSLWVSECVRRQTDSFTLHNFTSDWTNEQMPFQPSSQRDVWQHKKNDTNTTKTPENQNESNTHYFENNKK